MDNRLAKGFALPFMNLEVRVERVDLLLDTAWLVELLQSGGLVVLPYDCAPDSSVCLAAGHRAHWGVLTGRPAFNISALFSYFSLISQTSLSLSLSHQDLILEKKF